MAVTSAYRNWVGVRPITVTTLIATAVAAAATSVKVVSGTNITTSSTIVILDGPLTEVKAVTGVTTNTLTVAALAHAHRAGVYVFALPTSGFGPSNYVPLRTFKVPDKVDQLYDLAKVGSMVGPRAVAQGIRQSEWTMEGDFFADTSGFFLAGIFGTDATVAGTPTPPNTHTISLKNTGTGQPVKLSFWVYDGVNTRVVVGRFSKLGLKFDPEQFAAFSATLLARASGVVSTPTKSFSSLVPLPTWEGTLSIATTYSRLPMSFEVTFERMEAANIFTINGTQDPLTTFLGALTAKGKGVYVKTGDTQLSAYLSGTIQKFVFALTQGTGATALQLKLQFSKVNYDSVEVGLQGKPINTEAFAFQAIGNTTDHGATGGLAPCKVTLKNAVAATVYL